MTPASSAILEVERAAGDLRRGRSVLLTGLNRGLVAVCAGEHSAQTPADLDAAHPAVQLLRIAGLLPRAVFLPADGEEDRLQVSTQAIAAYPQALAASVIRVSEARVPLAGAENTRIVAFRPRFGHEEHLAVLIGEPENQALPLVRVHSSCVTGDLFGSLRCDCGGQLALALRRIAEAGHGAILYLSQEGRGIGIANKLRAYRLQDGGLDTVEANEALGFAPDERDFAVAGAILKELGLGRITLLTNNPAKVAALEAQGIVVKERLPLKIKANLHNKQYLDTKTLKMGHQSD